MPLLLLLLLRSWTNSSLFSLSTSAGVMDLQRFLCWRVTLLLLLSKTLTLITLMTCVWIKGKTTCCKRKKSRKIIRDVLTLSYYSNNEGVFLVSPNNTKKDHGGAFFF